MARIQPVVIVVVVVYSYKSIIAMSKKKHEGALMTPEESYYAYSYSQFKQGPSTNSHLPWRMMWNDVCDCFKSVLRNAVGRVGRNHTHFNISFSHYPTPELRSYSMTYQNGSLHEELQCLPEGACFNMKLCAIILLSKNEASELERLLNRTYGHDPYPLRTLPRYWSRRRLLFGRPQTSHMLVQLRWLLSTH